MPAGEKIFTGMDGLLHEAIGLYKRKTFSIDALKQEAAAVYQASLEAAALSDEQLAGEIAESRRRVCSGKSGDAPAGALAFVSEAAFRCLAIRPYIEQLMGALAIYRGYAIEMLTGEGKTLSAAIAAVLAGWRGKPCHIVTSNDYLAKRDAEWTNPLYARCGLSVGYVIGSMPPAERKKAYDCAITYSTSKELLADFLRDRMSEETEGNPRRTLIQNIASGMRGNSKVMRGLHTAFIDEADSVLADEATVPLIISAPGKDRHLGNAVISAMAAADRLRPDIDYFLCESQFSIDIVPSGRKIIKALLNALPTAWNSYWRFEYLVQQSLVARHFYHRDVHYVVRDDKIVIVDEKTGRMMPERSWSNGLHQAIEAREGIPLTDISEAQIRMSFQSFFRRYAHLAGLSGTLQNVERELWSIYGLIVVKIPPHLPKQLKTGGEKVCLNAGEKWNAVIEEVRCQLSLGKAVLLGTRSIKESMAMHRRLGEIGIAATVLNAHFHEEEAAIIARAGQWKRVTIATNMAGRGTDIPVDENVLQAGGLHVIVTERHESRRVDKQLIGRTARQGRPGSARMIVSLDDEVMRRFSPAWVTALLKTIIHSRWGEECARRVYIFFQNRAEKSRSRLRKRILHQDMQLEKVLSFTRY